MSAAEEPDVDERSKAFAKSCWEYIDGQRAKMPTGAEPEFNLHPYLAAGIQAQIAKEAACVPRPKAVQQQQQLL